jgi:hypothetical protein
MVMMTATSVVIESTCRGTRLALVSLASNCSCRRHIGRARPIGAVRVIVPEHVQRAMHDEPRDFLPDA